MTLAVCVLITWFIFIFLSLLPKKLSDHDMIFLYFMNTIFEVSIFTVLSINVKWISASHDVEKSIAGIVIRFIMIPILFVILTNFLFHSSKYIKWILLIIIFLYYLWVKWLLISLGIIAFQQWNFIYESLLFIICTIFSCGTAWVISRVEGEH